MMPIKQVGRGAVATTAQIAFMQHTYQFLVQHQTGCKNSTLNLIITRYGQNTLNLNRLIDSLFCCYILSSIREKFRKAR